MTNFCQCGSPWISGDKCDRCNKQIKPERLNLVQQEQPNQSLNENNTKVASARVNPDLGVQAALRVRKYGTLWDQIGSVINILNTIGAGILFIFLLISGLDGKIILLGLVAIILLWGLSYLQISIVKGLASYFQMRSADYLERRDRK
jgi:hypothetical protein